MKLHICGNISHLISSIKYLDVDILDTDCQVDMDYANSVMEDNVVCCGNINPLEVQDLNSERLAEKIRELLKKENGRKFILSAGCEITVNTPPENLKLMSRLRF